MMTNRPTLAAGTRVRFLQEVHDAFFGARTIEFDAVIVRAYNVAVNHPDCPHYVIEDESGQQHYVSHRHVIEL